MTILNEYSVFQVIISVPVNHAFKRCCLGGLWPIDNHLSLDNTFEVTIFSAAKGNSDVYVNQMNKGKISVWQHQWKHLCHFTYLSFIAILFQAFHPQSIFSNVIFSLFTDGGLFLFLCARKHQTSNWSLGILIPQSLHQIFLLFVIWNTVVNVVIPVWLMLPFWVAHVLLVSPYHCG